MYNIIRMSSEHWNKGKIPIKLPYPSVNSVWVFTCEICNYGNGWDIESWFGMCISIVKF